MLAAQEGDTNAEGRLVSYYQRRVDEVIQRRFANIRDTAEIESIGMEALLILLRAYQPGRHVPVQAWLRKNLHLRMIDLLRSTTIFNRAAVDFDKRLHEVMTTHPDMTEEQAARHVVGTVERRDMMYTEQRVADLMRGRAMSMALYLDYAADGEVLSARVPDFSRTPEEAVIRGEEIDNATEAVRVLFAQLSEEDRRLTLALYTSEEDLRELAASMGIHVEKARKRAQRILNDLRESVAPAG